MLRHCWCVLVLFICLVSNGLSQENVSNTYDWPQFRGPMRDGLSREKGLLTQWPEEGPKLLWNSKEVNKDNRAGIGRGFSSVAVAKGRVFTLGSIREKREKNTCAFCLEEATGKILWTTVITPNPRRTEPRSTPTVDGDRVYCLDRDGDLACLQVNDGKIIWKINYKKDLGGRMMSGWDYSESILIDGDRLICTPGGDEAALAALDKMTGKLIWKAEVPKGGGSGYASIVTAEVGGIKHYITWLGRCIVGVRAKDGKLLWRYSKNANGTANIPTSIVKDDLVFCTTAYGAGSSLLKLVPDGKGGVDAQEVYFHRGKTLQNHHGGVVLVGDYVYGGHDHSKGYPFCLNMKTGEFAWGPVDPPGGDARETGSAAVVYADGHLYFRYQNGLMALIEATPEEYRLKSTFRLPGYTGTPSWPHPVVANGKLFIRGNGLILCYDLRK